MYNLIAWGTYVPQAIAIIYAIMKKVNTIFTYLCRNMIYAEQIMRSCTFVMKENQTNFLKLCIADALLNLMENESYECISVSSVCEEAGVGRTTFYRHFDNKNGKEDALMFKIFYEWTAYAQNHKQEVERDGGAAFLYFIYENRQFFRVLYRNNLILSIMKIFEMSIAADWPQEKSSSYIRAFFTYGWFGAIYQWIKYDFDETPEQVLLHITDTILRHASSELETEKSK